VWLVVPVMRAGSLCSGVLGLDLAVEAVLGAELTWCSEVDRHACQVLEVRTGAPNLGDLTAVDWSTVEPVDVLTAGYPCQPFSTAGRRQGENDERHLWPAVAAAVRHLRPGLVVLENVSGHASMGLDAVVGDLAGAGYDAAWRCLRAADVGACHRRNRLFVVARPAADADLEPTRRHRAADARPQGADAGRRRPHDRDRPTNGARAAADTGGQRRHRRPDVDRAGRLEAEWVETCRDTGDGRRPPAADTDRDGRGWHGQPRRDDAARRDMAARGFGPYTPAVERWAAIVGRAAPPALKGRTLAAPFVEWMMGLPAGWVTDVVPNRHALRLLGNAVVPQQAARALELLLDDLAAEVAA
jgi:DNA (cytosine-5)-methyltransferase 1